MSPRSVAAILAACLAACCAACLAVSPALAAKKALFDNTHAQTAGNADWIIDTDQPLPVPAQSGVTGATPENFWTGANSSWGIALVKRGYQVATLTSSFGITYQNPSNPYDLSNYDVFIVNEPNTAFTQAESTAIFNYVRDGGGLFAISDHNGSDRNNDGIDSPAIWNKVDAAQRWGVHFGVTGDANNSITQVATNVNGAASDSIIHGAAGTATGISFHAGTTMTLNPTANATVTGDVWMNAAANGGTTGVMVAHAKYGAGRVVFVTDSSPADDGTGSQGTVFNGWAELAGSQADSLIFLNGTLWATRSGAAGDTQAPVITLTSPVGGESWGVGTVHAITWTASDNVGVTSVDLVYSTNGGATYPNTIATGLANTGSFNWTVPAVLSSTVRVRATAHDAAGNAGLSSSPANFSTTGWAITATPGVHGTILPAGTTVVADGATPAYTFTPDPGYHVADVLLDAVSQGAVTVFNFPAVHANHTIAATFAVNTSDTQAPVVTLGSPAGGESWAAGSAHAITWTASDNVAVTSVDLAWSADGGATFPNVIANGLANSGTFNWTVPGVLTSTARVRATAHDGAGNLAADSSHADFAITGWTITASAGANGSIAPAGAVVVGDGATPSFAITPVAGYHVQDVLVDGVSVGAVTNYTFLPVHANQTIAASFAPSDFTVNVTVSGSGSVAKSPNQPTYAGGSSVQLTATADPGWTFAGWSGDASGSANPLTVNVTSNLNITATFSQHVYTWTASGTSAWTTAANWNPARTAPASDDVLIFNGGGAVTANAIPAQSIGKLQVANNTNVSLVPSAAVTLTMLGSNGLGLDVDAGSQVSVSGTTVLTLVTSAATIRGTVALSGAGHRLMSGTTNGIVFQNGSVLTLGTGMSGNVFGTGVAPGALNSVVFQNGSLLAQGSGANPFGATAPNAVVSFQPGSRFRMDGALTPSMSGRSYADFELNNAAANLSPTGGTAWSVDSLIISQGTLNVSSLTGGGTIRGSLNVKAGAVLTIAPAAAYSLTLGGTAANRVNVAGTFSPNSNVNVTMSDPAGVTLTTNLALNGGLAFANGRITTGGNTLTISSSGSLTGAGQGTGWVAGNLKRNVSAGSSSRTFDVGDASTYAPVTLAVTGAASAFDLTASTSTPDSPNLGTSDLDPSRSVNRYWTLTPTGSPAFTSYDATLSFASGDVDPLATPANFLVRRFSGSWSNAGVGARTATSTQGTGLTGFGDLAIGERLTYALTVNVNGGGTVAKSPDQPTYLPGTVVQLTATPDPGFVFAGWSGTVSGAANPIPVTMDAAKSVTATFTGITYAIDASAGPNGTISPSGTIVVNTGGSQAFTITPDDGWQVLDVLVDGASVGAVTSYAFNGVTANHTIAASFTPVIAGVFDGPLALALARPHPNPSVGATMLSFSLAVAAHARIEIVDAGGRRVALHEGAFAAGRYQWRWDGVDASGARVGSGIYFARLTTPQGTRTQRIALLR